MGNLLSWRYWLDMRPGAFIPQAQLYFLIFLGVLLFGAVFFAIIKKRSKSAYTKVFVSLYNFCLTNMLIGALLWFFAYEMLPFLSMRLWFLLWVMGILAWLGFIGYKLSLVPKIKEEKIKLKEFNKYIP